MKAAGRAAPSTERSGLPRRPPPIRVLGNELAGWATQRLATSRLGALYGIGIDLVDLPEVTRHARRAAYRRQILSDKESAECLRAPDPTLALAERFALKEACMKALGAGIRQGLWFRQIEVRAPPTGPPQLQLRRAAAARFAQLGAQRLEAAVTRRGELVVALVLIGAAADP